MSLNVKVEFKFPVIARQEQPWTPNGRTAVLPCEAIRRAWSRSGKTIYSGSRQRYEVATSQAPRNDSGFDELSG